MGKHIWRRYGIKVLSVALAGSMIVSSSAFAGTWQRLDAGWQYEEENGRFIQSGWLQDSDRKWYHFNENGIMQTGWFQDVDGIWYYLDLSGAMAANQWILDTDGKWYYLNPSGAMAANQWVLDANGKWYYTGSTGAMQTSGYTPDGYYVNPDGSWNENVARRDMNAGSGSSGSSSSSSGGGQNKPDIPDTPDEPVIPDNPDIPDDPDTPDNPDTPDDPDTPDNPDTPDDPDTPEDPDIPDNPDILLSSVAIAANLAENAGAVSKGTIEFLTGTTKRYTVDTDNTAAAGLTTTAVSAGGFLSQISENLDSSYSAVLTDEQGNTKAGSAEIISGDILTVTGGEEIESYEVIVKESALRGTLETEDKYLTVGTDKDLTLNFHAGQRTPDAVVVIDVPEGITVTMDQTYVNIIGRGEVLLSELSEQSPGRWGGGYEVSVGTAVIESKEDGGSRIKLTGLDLKPDNGIDVQLRIEDVNVSKEGSYLFSAEYQTTEPQELKSPATSLEIQAVTTVTSFERVLSKAAVYDTKTDYQAAEFAWAEAEGADKIILRYSIDRGENWRTYVEMPGNITEVSVRDLLPEKEYWFKLDVEGGTSEGSSNIAKLYSAMYNVRTTGGAPVNGSNAADKIDEAIDYLNSIGGGTVLFEGGTFDTTTIHLKSNVYLYIDKTAELRALKGCDAPEVTWYSDKSYRSGTSPTSTGPYTDPENWLTKQDVGHTYWSNAMFYGQRLDNIKIIGNGRISGNGNLNTGDGVMNNSADNRADKMVSLKLCTNFEMGGLSKPKDLWYEETEDPNNDEPFYLNTDGSRDSDISNMLRISRGGHFVMLATGVDGVSTHDVYAEKSTGGGVRDIFDYMACSDVTAVNIYAAGSSDDIVKPGSDCSLGFTRPAKNYVVRNIIGDTNCNLFQIGSETADDIQNICVDNIYVLAANKAGFSISTNDGGHVKDIHLNCGGTVGECVYGITHEDLDYGYKPAAVHPFASEMRRTRAPFFLSISNRGRIMGGEAKRMKFTDPNGTERDELLSTNVNIGYVENIFINNVNVEEVYGGSQYKGTRWAEYGKQNKAVPIIAGYAVPEGVGITLPDERDIGYLEHVSFNNVNVLVKGGNPLSDAFNSPKEMGVGQYNVGDLAGDASGSMLPAYGFWVRHVKDFSMNNCTASYEKNDDRFAVVLDDVDGANLRNIKLVQPENNRNVLELLDCRDISMSDSTYYERTMSGISHELSELSGVTVEGKQTYPYPVSESVIVVKKADAKENVADVIDAEGLKVQVLFGASVEKLIASIEADDGSSQSYAVFRSGAQIVTGELQNGDVLRVTSESLSKQAEYSITVEASRCTAILMKSEDGCVTAVDNADKTLSVIKGTTAGTLFDAIQAEDLSEQSYFVDGKAENELIIDGDILAVQAADGITTAEYAITVGEDLRIRAVEGSYFVQAVNSVKNTISVLKGTTPKQLKASVEARSEETELVFTVKTSKGEEKEKGAVAAGDILVVSSEGDTGISQTYKITPVLYASDSIIAEGETTPFVMTGSTMTNKTNNDSNAGAGVNRQFSNLMVGDYVEYTIADVPAGSYELIYTYKTANDNRRAIVGARFNGVDTEGEADANFATANLYKAFSFGMVRQEEDGDAVVRLTAVGKGSGSSPYNFIVDRLELKGSPSPNTNLEAEGNKVINVDNDDRIITMKGNSSVEDILGLKAADGSVQKYEVIREEAVLEEGKLETGDIIMVTSQNGENEAAYNVVIDDTVVSRELRYQTNQWISGEFYIEPGTTVGDLSSLIECDMEITFKVVSGGTEKLDDEIICTGDKIKVLNVEDESDVIETITAEVYSETSFAVYDEEKKLAFSGNVASPSDAQKKFKTGSDSIFKSNTNLKVPYIQATSKKAGDMISLEIDVPVDGKYRAELVYKGGNRSKKVQTSIEYEDNIIQTNELNVADETGALWLADMPDRNTSKTYMVKTIGTKELNEGMNIFHFKNMEANDMVLVEVRLTLLSGAVQEEKEEADVMSRLKKKGENDPVKQESSELAEETAEEGIEKTEKIEEAEIETVPSIPEAAEVPESEPEVSDKKENWEESDSLTEKDAPADAVQESAEKIQ